MRIEKDSLGKMEIPDEVPYGIHTQRALENFRVGKRRVSLDLIYAIVQIKKAAAMANNKIGELEDDKTKAIIEACDEVLDGRHDECFVTCNMQGGAGTSANMNVNEVICNLALKKLGRPFGGYDYLHPLNHVNKSQSTNDVYPTALRIAAIYKIRTLSEALAALQESLQRKETEFEDVIKLGRTQMMDALPVMLGQEFSCYALAISRDRWRIYKVEERLRQTNLGGTAVGTGMNAEREYIYNITSTIREITGLGLARAETMMDITQNNDVFVEVSGLLKSAAVNMMKIANDLRLLGSGPKGGLGEIVLQPVQAGSSIMPGKFNPVIPELAVQVSMAVIANDTAITLAASQGSLELNAFTPLIADRLLESLDLMIDSVNIFKEKCIDTLSADVERCRQLLEDSKVMATALTHYIGYDKAAELVRIAHETGETVMQTALQYTDLDKNKLKSILDDYQVTTIGIPK